MRLEAYVSEWLDTLIAKPGTKKRYASICRHHILPELAQLELEAIDLRVLKRYFAKKAGLALSDSTIAYAAAVLRMILSSAVEDGLLEHNTAEPWIRKMKLTKKAQNSTRSRIKALTLEELRRLLEQAWKEPRYYYPIATLAWSGIRLGELRALTAQDCDLRARQMHITKTVPAGAGAKEQTPKSGTARSVELPTALVSDLDRWILEIRPALVRKWGLTRPPPPLFFSELGNRLCARSFARVFDRIVAAAGLPRHSPHDLRHTYASLQLQRGESLQFVSHQLGHSSIAFTHAVYGRWLRPLSKSVLEELASSPAQASPAKVVKFPTR